jgi:hypothetical protein
MWVDGHDGGAMERETRRLDEWGPVCRGFLVLLPDGGRGSVQDIRVGDEGVELLVETGLFVRRGLIVGAHDVEAILPAAFQLVVRDSRGAESGDGAEVEAAGGIVRMPLHRLPEFSLPSKEAA